MTHGDPIARALLAQTVPQSAFSPAGIASHLSGTSPVADRPRDDSAPELAGEFVEGRLRHERRGGDAEPGRRFAIEGMLGAGATARVYAVLDRNLERPLAVKVMAGDGAPSDADIASFLAEARLTAALAHPNVLPVHELDVDAAGRVYFTMKRIDGRSLSDAIELSALGARDAAIADANAVATIAIAVAQALAYAHARRVVHQDVKPANIMLGAFGEVLLVDWGSAARLEPGAAPNIYGTPLYMSPEQARSEGVDERSDVYCLGATLFHALLLRLPTWSEDPEEFWRRKRVGAIDAPSVPERAAVPAPLLDIVLKALASAPRDRYQGADAMLRDLRAWQAGLSVSAHRDSVLERVRRWHGRHARALWSTVAVAAVVLSLVAALYGERLKELAEWGKPVVLEEFDAGWDSRWLLHEGRFEAREGRVVTTAVGASTMYFPRKLWGPVAMEYEAEMLPGSRACDLSLLWARDADLSADGARVEQVHDVYQVQFGAYDGSYTTIRRGGGSGQHLACSDAYPRHGVRYRIRVEIEDQRIALLIDGRLECEWIDPVRFDGGWVALYGHYPGKAFDGVRIFQRGVPQKVPITAIGDAFLRAGDHERAQQQFARVVASHPATDVGREALYKQGLCRWLQDRRDEAEAVWHPLTQPGMDAELDERVRLHRIDRLIAADDHAATLAAMERFAEHCSAQGRKLLAMRWAPHIDALRVKGHDEAVTAQMSLFDRRLADEKTADVSAAYALLHLGRHQEMIDRFPRQRLLHCAALEAMGRLDVVADHYEDQLRRCELARFAIGQSHRIDPVENPGLYSVGLVKRGLAAEAIVRYRDGPRSAQAGLRHALLVLGRFDELDAIPDLDPWMRAVTLIHRGRIAEALAAHSPPTPIARFASGDPIGAAKGIALSNAFASRLRHAAAIDDWIAGRRDDAVAELDQCHPAADSNEDLCLVHDVLFPLLRAQAAGDWSLFDRSVEAHGSHRWRIEQKPWHDARFLRGEIGDAAFLAQPHCGYSGPRLLLLRAVRHERHGRTAEALADWRAWLATPSWTRSFEPELATQRFVEWRVRVLAAR